MPAPGAAQAARKTWRVVAYDFGVKQNILRRLVDVGCEVTVVPASTPAKDVLALNPQGLFLSNGPGDPEGVPYAMDALRELIGRLPIFGICLGHQLLGLALGFLDLQAEVRPPWRQSPGHRPPDQKGRDHLAEP
jgi:carbamoyl-phosphate synthase small subunit